MNGTIGVTQYLPDDPARFAIARSPRPSYLRGCPPDYGRWPTGRGGIVTIRSLAGARRVSIRPAFDSLATSMVALPTGGIR